MKDLIIKKSVLKREIRNLIIAFITAIIINIYAIAKYNASWYELFSQLPVVILISVLIYFLFLILRAILKTVLKIYMLFKQ